MMNKKIFWIRTTLVLQFLTFLVHSTSLIVKPQPESETEKQLIGLMENYKLDLGFGFMRSMSNLMMSFSISFSLLLLCTAMINWQLLKLRVENKVWEGMMMIQVIIYFLCFLAMVFLTFLPPIVCIGLILISVGISYGVIRSAVRY